MLFKNHRPKLDWKQQMISQDCNIIALMNVLALISLFYAADGKCNPKGFLSST